MSLEITATGVLTTHFSQATPTPATHNGARSAAAGRRKTKTTTGKPPSARKRDTARRLNYWKNKTAAPDSDNLVLNNVSLHPTAQTPKLLDKSLYWHQAGVEKTKPATPTPADNVTISTPTPKVVKPVPVLEAQVSPVPVLEAKATPTTVPVLEVSPVPVLEAKMSQQPTTVPALEAKTSPVPVLETKCNPTSTTEAKTTPSNVPALEAKTSPVPKLETKLPHTHVPLLRPPRPRNLF